MSYQILLRLGDCRKLCSAGEHLFGAITDAAFRYGRMNVLVPPKDRDQFSRTLRASIHEHIAELLECAVAEYLPPKPPDQPE